MNLPDLNTHCGICGSEIQSRYPSHRDNYSYSCKICGRVNITHQAVIHIVQNLQESRHLLSGFTRERTDLELSPIDITARNVEVLITGANVPNSVSEKLDRILLFLEKKSDYAGNWVNIEIYIDYPVAYAKNGDELAFLLGQLKNQGVIERDSTRCRLTMEGWDRIVELSRNPKTSSQAFVAMWFTTETETTYKEGIEKAVTESGFSPLRVDKLEHNNKICDLIIAEIRKSKFLVADFTGHRGGVYFEAGFALGLGIPVIWLCRKDQIDQAHFDTRQYNHIVWGNEADLYEKLRNRINATIIR